MLPGEDKFGKAMSWTRFLRTRTSRGRPWGSLVLRQTRLPVVALSRNPVVRDRKWQRWN